MKDTPTPETDAAAGTGNFANCVDIDFARKLERERNAILQASVADTRRMDWLESCAQSVTDSSGNQLRGDIREAIDACAGGETE